MQITEQEAALLEALRRLPGSAVDQLTALTHRLASIRPDAVDWSDSWTDEDLRDFSRGSVERLDQEDSGNHS